MPIAPDRLQHYPGGSIRSVAWREIRAQILERAGGRCERTPQRPNCEAADGIRHPETGSIVVLTVAHMDHDVIDHSPENLRALCQRCHNLWDSASRTRNAIATRARKLAAGTGDLFTCEELP